MVVEHRGDRPLESIGRIWLANNRKALFSGHGGLVTVAGCEDDANFRMMFPYKPTQFQPAHARHNDVGQNKIDITPLVQGFDRASAELANSTLQPY